MKPKTWIKCSIIVLGVIIIPLLYSYFYLGAFWDPYNRLETVPVAIVNLDEGAVINGEQRNVGDEVCDKIVDDGTMKFIKTDNEDATDGVNGTKYYAVIRVPKDFSSKVATSTETDKEISEITYSANMKHNYICSQIMKNAVLTIEEQTRDSINKEIVQTLCDNLKKVPDNMQTLSDGMNDLSDGSKQLSDGTSDFCDGQSEFTKGLITFSSGMNDLNDGGKALYSGISTLNDGITQVKDGTNELASGVSDLPKLVSGVSELNDGATALLNQTKLTSNYSTNPVTINDGITGLNDGLTLLYNTITSSASTSPKTGSQQISSGISQLSNSMFETSGDTSNPSIYDGIQGVNAGVNQLSTSVGTLATSSSDSNAQASTYLNSVNSMLYSMIKADTDKYTDQITTYAYLLNQLNQIPASNWTDEQKSQVSQITNVLYIYIAGVQSTDVYNFNAALSKTSLDDFNSELGIDSSSPFYGVTMELKESNPYVQTIVSAGNSLSSGVAQIKAGTNSLASIFAPSSSSDLYTSVYALNQGSAQLAAAFGDNGSLTSGIKQLKDGSDTLKASYNGDYTDGVTALSNGMNTLLSSATSLGKLTDGIDQLNEGAIALNSGSSELLSGSAALSEGINTATNGTSSLLNGNSQLVDAATQIRDGSKELDDGINTAKDGVNDAITDANDQLKQTEGLAEYAENPVNVNEEDINHLPNYGSAFAPYFMSLSLYVGALLMFFGIYLDADERIKFLSRSSNKRGIRILGFAGIGVAQAIVLGIICQFALKLSISNIPMFYLSCIIISLVFVEIVGFLLITLKDIGKFLSIAFLVLNLTSCGGTFPMETTPGIFRFLYPYMPMTYSVNLLKETTVNFNNDTARYNILILLGIFALFVGLNLLFGLTKKAKVKVQEIVESNANSSKA